MDKKEVVIDGPMAVDGVTVIPVAKVSLNYRHGNSSLSFFGFKQPIGVVVVSQSVKKAFRITGEEVSIDQLMQEVPSIREMLERL